MFTQAGFRDDYEVLGAATVGQFGTGGRVRGHLLRWPDGDIAWASTTKICWPHQAFVYGDCPDALRSLHEQAGGRSVR